MLDRDERIADARGVPPFFFHQVYDALNLPPWEIDRAQRAVRDAMQRGWFASTLLDVGCGTGCNAVMLAQAGFDVVGTDLVPAAIRVAQTRAMDAGAASRVRFVVCDALDMRGFVEDGCVSSVLDSAFCHVLSDADRPRYVEELRRCTRKGASIVMLNFNEHESRGGPRRMSIDDCAAMLGAEFRLDCAVETRYESTAHEGGAAAWLLRFLR